MLTHDVTTLVPLAHQWIRLGQPMAGVFAVHQHSPFGPVIDDLVLLAGATDPHEWRDRVLWLPL